MNNQILKNVPQSLIDAVKSVTEAKSGDKEEYQKFFNDTLDKFGVDSPAELDVDKKKEFFNYIDKEWKGKGEKKEEIDIEELDEEITPADFKSNIDTKAVRFRKSDPDYESLEDEANQIAKMLGASRSDLRLVDGAFSDYLDDIDEFEENAFNKGKTVYTDLSTLHLMTHKKNKNVKIVQVDTNGEYQSFSGYYWNLKSAKDLIAAMNEYSSQPKGKSSKGAEKSGPSIQPGSTEDMKKAALNIATTAKWRDSKKYDKLIAAYKNTLKSEKDRNKFDIIMDLTMSWAGYDPTPERPGLYKSKLDKIK